MELYLAVVPLITSNASSMKQLVSKLYIVAFRIVHCDNGAHEVIHTLWYSSKICKEKKEQYCIIIYLSEGYVIFSSILFLF